MHSSQIKPPRILVVEDDRHFFNVVQAWLSKRGYDVELAENSEQCLAKARSLKPALIILDINMPGVHGLETLKQLRADEPTRDLAVILCTVKDYKPDRDQAWELGVLDILIKPTSKEELLEAVDRFFKGTTRIERTREAISEVAPYLPQIPASHRSYRFWGTRGSIPVSGRRYVRHGGNTSCLQVNCGEDSFIIDAGSGIRDLGYRLVKQSPRRIHILITHTHWDHIQGFPFFAPAYEPGFELVIHGASGFKKDLKSIFLGQLDRDYFPAQFEDMRAKIEFCPLDKNSVEIGKFNIAWEYVNHPAVTVGFRIEVEGKKLGYVTDNEFLNGYFGSPLGMTTKSQELTPFRSQVEFLKDVDVLISEAQYTNEEYLSKKGWGHSSLSNACLMATLAGVKRWVITHHDPLHDDEFLEQKLNLTKGILRSLENTIETNHAYDGMTEYY